MGERLCPKLRATLPSMHRLREEVIIFRRAMPTAVFLHFRRP
jgi:hypothetical protein